jgi:OTT_1508-like deaminase
LKELLDAKEVLKGGISAVELRMLESPTIPHTSTSALQGFLGWFSQFFAIKNLPPNPEPEALVHYIRWAQEAKRSHLESLKVAFSTQTHQLPRWIYAIFKLGRYGIASKAFVRLASEFPSLFNPMVVEPVIPPQSTRYTVLKDDKPLTSTLRRMAGGHEKEYLSRLANIWDTADPEAHFRKACSRNLVVHAEMQLISFYDHHSGYKPSFRFIGVSKKSCYLCHMFLASHPDSFGVSSCHQKLYVSWIPPPAVESNIYRRYKRMTTELSKVMELAARRDLDYRLGALRTGGVADSTAGVSLSGLTEVSAIDVGVQAYLRSQEELSVLQRSADEGFITMRDEMAEEESPCPVGVSGSSSLINETWPINSNRVPTAIPTEQSSESNSATPISTMVFHFMRAGDPARQDIISMSDIFDPTTNYPSWANLVEVLKVDNNYGLAFREGSEFLMINNRVRVSNERQFRACLQYLCNSKILNSEALVCEF